MTRNTDILATKRVINQQRARVAVNKIARKRERVMRGKIAAYSKKGSASLCSEALNTLVTRSLRFLSLYTLVDLFAMYRNFFRRINANTDLVTFNTQHRYSYLIANHEGFTNSTS